MLDIPFIPTKNFTAGTPGWRKYDLVVIHDMEYPERLTAAEDVARYFQRTDRQVSSHYCIDADSIVQCVNLDDVAWCAPGANHNGFHLEHAGYARQTRAEWLDPYSQAMLELSAELTAWLCAKYNIPVRFVRSSGLQINLRGITTHNEVSRAFGKSSHWDPGPNFPMDWYLGRVKSSMDKGNTPAPQDKPWPVPIPKWFWGWARWHFAGRPRDQRPADAPARIPVWAWKRLWALQQRRNR